MVYGLVALAAIATTVLFVYLASQTAIFQPAGTIARQQKDLIIFTTLLGMIVVIPVFIMLFWFAWRYREDNTKAAYHPEESGNRYLETLWWGIPIVIILILSVVTWVSTHQLDPYKTVASDNQPIRVQVVAMQWRWLFIYPDFGLVTINEVRFPEKTPVNFELTADAPMSAFWIPKLGGQTYAMSAMSARLSIMADEPGTYRGSNTNISGKGYANMNFDAISQTDSDFSKWVDTIKQSPPINLASYNVLAEPSDDYGVHYYSLADNNLYNDIMSKYMDGGMKTETDTSATDHSGMNH